MMPSDIELIEKVKKENDSLALSELINRHTGLYINIVNEFSGRSSKININDVKDDKAFHIYKCVLSYNPELKMKFSTYVGEMTKYMCKNIINRAPESCLIDENMPSNDENINHIVEKDDSISEINESAKKITDKRFFEIYKMRFFSGGKPSSWREIGNKLGISGEGARKIYNKNIKYLKQNLIHE